MDLRECMRMYDAVERDFEASIAAYGVPFEPEESSPRSLRRRAAERCGCHCENGDSSLWTTWISPACIACRTSERTASLFVDLRCTRDCYFCFNPNQAHYDYFRTHERDIVLEIEQAHAAGARFDFLAVTGGEPMLHKPQVLAFLARAKELYPRVHIRMYTSGDLLDEEGLAQLAERGLDEIRFSVKPLDGGTGQGKVLALMERAVLVIPDVLIEMPVVPGTSEEMEDLLLRADAIGVRCINLIEMGFPLHNAEAFRSRGFKLRKRPFRYPYSYWYGGGVPVAGSEATALGLVEFAVARGLRTSVHYCSADNRNSGQVHVQNKAFDAVEGLRERYPWMSHDEGDRFLVCAKAFGEDAARAAAWARDTGVPYGLDEETPCAALPLNCAEVLRANVPGIELARSANIVEQPEEGAFSLVEVGLEPIAADARS